MANKRILLGVTGSIAAYKAADIINGLNKLGHTVDVIMTRSAAQFITPLTLQTLSQNKVHVEMFENNRPADMKHIPLAQAADVMLIAPATANIIGKMANGLADDLLSSTYLAVHGKPILLAPAMNTRMYENPMVQENIAKLEKCGVTLISPRKSRLACGVVGMGALANVTDIIAATDNALGAERND